MSSFEQQLSSLLTQVQALRDSIPVHKGVDGVTLEDHNPGNGTIYKRIKAARGKKLENGNRTMILQSADDISKWERQIYARNQREKATQCAIRIKEALEIAQHITWDVSQACKAEISQLIDE
ncbi:MAG: hypothetical protein ABG776_07625 [Cyanobacteria bacterium J06555_13]